MPLWLSPILVFLAVMAYGGLHSLLASERLKTWVQKRFGEKACQIYRLGYNIFAIVALFPVLALPMLLPDRALYIIPIPWSLLTLALQGLAALTALIGLFQTGVWSFLGLQQLMQPPCQEDGELIIRGLYRWTRHPLYTAALVFIWLTPVMTINALALNLGLTVYIVIGARLEEGKLLKQFGEHYQNYRTHTPFLIPWPPK